MAALVKTTVTSVIQVTNAFFFFLQTLHRASNLRYMNGTEDVITSLLIKISTSPSSSIYRLFTPPSSSSPALIITSATRGRCLTKKTHILKKTNIYILVSKLFIKGTVCNVPFRSGIKVIY